MNKQLYQLHELYKKHNYKSTGRYVSRCHIMRCECGAFIELYSSGDSVHYAQLKRHDLKICVAETIYCLPEKMRRAYADFILAKCNVHAIAEMVNMPKKDLAAAKARGLVTRAEAKHYEENKS